MGEGGEGEMELPKAVGGSLGRLGIVEARPMQGSEVKAVADRLPWRARNYAWFMGLLEYRMREPPS
jgi:hypothetical protein